MLSIPEKTFIMPRFDKITIRRYDENGRKQVDKLNGFISRLFQHEMEHLQGRLMIGGKIHDEMPVDKAVEKIYDELSNYYSQNDNDLNIWWLQLNSLHDNDIHLFEDEHKYELRSNPSIIALSINWQGISDWDIDQKIEKDKTILLFLSLIHISEPTRPY